MNSGASLFNGDVAQVVRKLRPVAGGLMTVLSTETHSYAVSGGVKREEIRTTATGSPHTHLEITENWTGEAAEPLNRGRLRMSQGVDGVQRWYSYAPDYQHGALYTITEETRVEGEPVAGQPLTSTQKQLISQFSPTLESKVISVSELGLLYLTRG